MKKQSIDLKNTTPVSCEYCGSDVFESRILMRKTSSLSINGPQNAIIRIEVLLCAVCGNLRKADLENMHPVVKQSLVNYIMKFAAEVAEEIKNVDKDNGKSQTEDN